MSSSTKRKRSPRVVVERQRWPEASVVAEPVSATALEGPRLLVRRNEGMLFGPHGEEVLSLPGEPVISLFSGCGGMDLGVEEAGMCCVVQCEMASEACETLLINRPRCFRHAALIQGDIRSVPTGLLLREGGLRVGEATLVCGGPPCQGFSTANSKSHSGTFDVRNDLVWEFLRVVDEAKPRFFVFENVPGFMRFNKGEYFRAFLRRAYDCYYELVYGLIDAREHGVPQHRCRFLCMATRRDLWEIDHVLGALPKPSTFSHADRARVLELEREFWFPPEEHAALTHAPGVRYFPDRPVLVPPAPIHHASDGRAENFLDFYSRLDRDEPDRVVRQPQHYQEA